MENITIKSNDMSNSTSETEKSEQKNEKTLDKLSCPLIQSRSQPNVGIKFFITSTVLFLAYMPNMGLRLYRLEPLDSRNIRLEIGCLRPKQAAMNTAFEGLSP